jgi:hypothetical protein
VIPREALRGLFKYKYTTESKSSHLVRIEEGMRGVNVLCVFRALGFQVCDRALACACVL